MKNQMLLYKDFGIRLATLRKNAGLTQTEIAEKLNTVQSTYSGYELGTRKITIDTIIAISEILDTTPDYLITGTPSSKDASIKDECWKNIMDAYLGINLEGKEKLSEYAQDLFGNPKYQKKTKLAMGQKNA